MIMALCFERKEKTYMYGVWSYRCWTKRHITDSKSDNTYHNTKYYHVDQEI